MSLGHNVSDEDYREFYCSAGCIPDDILRKTLSQMGGRWEFVDTKDIAPVLYNKGLLTHGEFCHLTNVHLDQVVRMNDLLYKILPSKGKEQYTLVSFYQYLLGCRMDGSIPTDLRAHALEICGVESPVLVPGISGSKTLNEILQQMIAKLTMYVPAEQAKDFAKSLNLSGNDLPDCTEIQLSELCQVWIEKKSHECTPEALVEALVCTMGLGKYASGIGAATNPPDVKSYFYSLQGRWWDLAAFLGYSKEDLDDVITEIDNSPHRQITKFLTKFRMPDCGACTITILHKAGGKAGISAQTKNAPFGHGLNSPVGMKGQHYSMSMPMLETFDEQPKPKPAAAAVHPPLLKPHGAAPPSQYYRLRMPPPHLAAMVMQVASIFASPPPPWWGAHCHSPLQGQVPPNYGYPGQEYFQTMAAQAQSYWQQTQYRGDESYESKSYDDSCTREQTAPASNLSDEVSSTTASNAACKPEDHTSEGPPQNDAVPTNALATNAPAVAKEDGVPGFPRTDGGNDLLKHCMKGDAEDIEIVATLLDSGASLEIQMDNDGSHPLHLAVLSKSFQMLSLLVPYYDSLHMIDVVRDDHKTPLMLACMEKNHDFVRIMLEHTASVNSKDCGGLSCLHLKETLESPDIVQLLIDKGADVDNLTDGSLLTPLAHACVLGLAQSVEILLDNGASPDGKPGAASTPLCAAAGEGHVHTVQALLDRNANVNLKDQEGCTPLLKACKAGQVDVASKLIAANAEKNCTDKGGNFPVLVAVDSNNTELLQLLLAQKADVNQFKVIVSSEPPREHEVTPLILAAGRGKLDMVEILVENKANVNYASQRTVSALTYAVGGGHVHVVEYLLKVNDMIRTIDVLYLPLLLAVKSDEQFILKLLLDALDGYEKALRDATDAGMQDLVEALAQLDDMGRPKTTETASERSASNSATLEPRHMRECANKTLVEFTRAAVMTAESKQGRPFLVDEARRKGHEHIVVFFEVFFAIPDAGTEMFAEFINMIPHPSPAIFIFENKMTFDGATFKNILDEMNSDCIEYLPVALMQTQGFDETQLDGEALVQLLFGKRFFETVQCLNLLEAALPALASNHAATGVGMPAQQQNQNTDYSQHDYSEHVDTDRDSCSPTYGDRACPPDSTSGVSSSVAVVIHSEDSEVVDDSAEDEGEVQDVEETQNVAVESHSQREESSASLTEPKDEGTLLEPAEQDLHHEAHSMPSNDSGDVKLVDSNCPAESKLTEQTGQGVAGRLKLSRTKSVPATSKTKIPQCYGHSPSSRATKRPPSFVHPTTGHVSNIPIRIAGKKLNQSMPLRSVSYSEGGGTDFLSSTPACHRSVTGTSSSASRIPKLMNSKSSVLQAKSEATVASGGHKHSTPKRGVSSKPQRVCGLDIPDTPIRNAEKLFELYSRRIVRWQRLAKYLNVHDSEIDMINRHYRFEEEKCFQMLCSWSKSAQNRATYACLAEGFRKIEQEYLIKDLHTPASNSCQETVEYDIDLSEDKWEAKLGELMKLLFEKQIEGFTAAKIHVKLEK